MNTKSIFIRAIAETKPLLTFSFNLARDSADEGNIMQPLILIIDDDAVLK